MDNSTDLSTIDISAVDNAPADSVMSDTTCSSRDSSSDAEGDMGNEDVIPDVPPHTLMEWLNFHGRTAITGYAIKSKREAGIPRSTKETDGYLERIELFLNFLEYGNFQVSPAYNAGAPAGAALRDSLRMVFDRSKHPQFHFPESHVTRAAALFNRFEALNWGATATASTSSGSHAAAQRPASSITHSSSRPQTTTRVLYPPADHPIWGVGGILHGLTPVEGSTRRRRAMILDSRYQQRRANIHGSNGLSLGQWFPNQHSALFHGAHGHSQAGIYGSAESGAYSVVVAAKYTDTDDDLGDTIFYSGPGSEDNKEPHKLPEGNTAPLEKSIESGQPVRVLRSGGFKSRPHRALAHSTARTYAPSVGIRYDGLYRVVRKTEKHNSHGGLYLAFELQRIPGQESLDHIQRRSPTTRNKRDYARRWNIDWETQ